MSDLNCTVTIGQLLPTDSFATINNNNALNSIQVNSNGAFDFGPYFDILDGVLHNSILNQMAQSSIVIQINSNVNNAITQANALTTGPQSNDLNNVTLIQQVNEFLNTLNGRPITVNMQHGTQASKIVYKGYITNPPSEINVKNGTQISLICLTLLGQLNTMSSNGDYQTATQSYGNIFSTVSANQVNLNQLLDVITENTLVDSNNIEIEDGVMSPMPDTLWAMILPDESRLEVLKELFIPYSRIIYQTEDGTINIQPLFIDDHANEVFNVDAYANAGNWISLFGTNHASSIPNRIDVLFGTALPVPARGLVTDPNIFASAPRITPGGLIEPQTINGIAYTDIYKTSTRLYNSGKFIMPQQKTIMVDNSLITNPSLINALTGLYTTNDLFNSIIYKSNDSSINSIPQLYAQLYLAMINVENYNATVVYDYLEVIDQDNPLAQIISINNYNVIDYPEMIVTDTILLFGGGQPTLLQVETAPLLSITGVWGSVGDGA